MSRIKYVKAEWYVKNKKFPDMKFCRTDPFITDNVALSNLTMGGTTARAGTVNRLNKTMKYSPVSFSTLTLSLFDNIAFKTESQLSAVWKRT